MPQTTLAATAKTAEELFDLVISLYTKYLDALEVYLDALPEAEVARIREVHEDIKEAQAALEHDLAVFDQAVQEDLEDLNQFQEKLKIQEIYKQLKS